MKFQQKTAAAILMAALTSGAYANVTQDQYNKLVEILFSQDQAVHDGQPVTDENGKAVKKGAVLALNDRVEDNAKKIDAVNTVQDAVIGNINNLTAQVNENSDDIWGVYAALDAAKASQDDLNAKADKSELDALKQALFSDYEATDEQGNPILDDEGNTIAEGLVVALANKVASNEEKIDLLSQAAVALAGKTQENADDLVAAYTDLDTKKADQSEIARLDSSIDTTDQNVAELYDVTNEHEVALLALDEKQAINAANIDILTDVKADKEDVDHLNASLIITDANVQRLYDVSNDQDAKIADLDQAQATNRTLIEVVAQATGKVLDDLEAEKADKTEVAALTRTVRINEARTNDQLVKLGEATLAAAEELDERKAEKSEITRLDESIADTDANVDHLYDAVNDHDSKILALDQAQAANAANIDILTDVKADKTEVQDVETKVLALAAVSAGIAKEVKDVKDNKADKTEVADLSNKLDAVNAVQDQAIDNINGLARQALINQARLDTVVATSAEHEAKIEAINAVQDQVIENVDALTRVVNDSNRITDARLKDKANTADVLELAEATLAAAQDLDNRKAEKTEVAALDAAKAEKSALANLATATVGALADLDDRLNAVNDVQDQVIENVEDLAAKVNENGQDILDAYNALDIAKAEKADVDAEVRNIHAAINGIANVTGQHLNDLEDNLLKLGEATLAAAEELDERKAEKADVLALAEATLAAAEELDARKAEKSEITRLDNLIDDATNKVAEGFETIQNAFTANDVRVAKVEERAKKVRADVKATNGRVDQTVTAINKLNGKVKKVEGAVADLEANKADKTEIERLDNLIDEATTAIAEGFQILEATKADNTKVENLAKQVDAVKADRVAVDALGNRVDNLEGELKSGLAANAALNGLFQPYNVGKVNVTAALGGYKSTTALAIGAGYRVNENLAAKAGIATSLKGDSGFTYNLGVNYEF